MSISVGSLVRVNPHTIYQHLSGGAVISPPKQYQHNGYREVEVLSIENNPVHGAVVEVAVGGMVDYVPLEACVDLEADYEAKIAREERESLSNPDGPGSWDYDDYVASLDE